MKKKTPFEQLQEVHSWELRKFSPTTFPNDVVNTLFRRGERHTKKELSGIMSYVQNGTAYRCRIGKGRSYFGKTMNDAITLALKAYKRTSKEKRGA